MWLSTSVWEASPVSPRPAVGLNIPASAAWSTLCCCPCQTALWELWATHSAAGAPQPPSVLVASRLCTAAPSTWVCGSHSPFLNCTGIFLTVSVCGRKCSDSRTVLQRWLFVEQLGPLCRTTSGLHVWDTDCWEMMIHNSCRNEASSSFTLDLPCPAETLPTGQKNHPAPVQPCYSVWE